MESQQDSFTLRQRLWACQQRHEFCDAILETETGDKVWAHKVILATGSKLLHNMLTSPGPQVARSGATGDVQVLTLSGVSVEELQELVRLLYLQDMEEVSVDIMALARYYQFYEPVLNRRETNAQLEQAELTAAYHGQLHAERNLVSTDPCCTYSTPASVLSTSTPDDERSSNSSSPIVSHAGHEPVMWPEVNIPPYLSTDQRLVVFSEANLMAVGNNLSSGHCDQEQSIDEEGQTCLNLTKQNDERQNSETGGDTVTNPTAEDKQNDIFIDLTTEDEDMSSAHPVDEGNVDIPVDIQTTRNEIDETTEGHASPKENSNKQSDGEARAWSPVLLEGLMLDSFDDSDDDNGKEPQQKEDSLAELRKPLLQVSDTRIVVSSNKENICPKSRKEISPPHRPSYPTKTVRRGRMKNRGSHKTPPGGIWMGGY